MAAPVGVASSAQKNVVAAWDTVGFGVGYMRFDRLGVSEGLSENTVQAILQDQQGFLWFGTQEGLNKYDGYAFIIYQADPNDPAALSDGYITDIVETPDGALWVGTYYGGLNRFDPATKTFERFLPDAADPGALPHERVNDLFLDSRGGLWVGTQNGLSRLNPDQSSFTTYAHRAADVHTLSNPTVLSIFEDDKGRLWVGTEDGLNRFDPETGAFDRIMKGISAGLSQIYAIADAGEDFLWLGTHGGLVQYDIRRSVYLIYRYKSSASGSLSSNLINVLYQDKSGNLWIGFDDAGVNLMTGVQDDQVTVIAYGHQDYDAFSLSHNSVQAIYEDRSGLMWFGTLGGGINKANPATRNFGYHRHNPNDNNSLASNNITALAYDVGRHSLWIGTAETGLDRLSLNSGSFTHFRAGEDDDFSPGSDQIKLLYFSSAGKLFVSAEGAPLAYYDPVGDRFIPFLVSEGNSRISVTTRAMVQDEFGNYWLSQENGEVLYVAPDGLVLVRYRLGTNIPLPENNELATALLVDEAGFLWMGLETQGLLRLDPGSGETKRYSADGTEKGPSHNSITSLYQDEAGILWIGTAGGGLNRFDPASETFTAYATGEGFPSNRILGILPDLAGNLWLSSSNGLARLDPHTGAVRVYEPQDGLQGSTFNRNAYAAGEGGALFFGGVDGLNAFYPQQIVDNAFAPPMVITSVSLFNETLVTDITDCATTLSLTYDQNFLSFDFAALDFTDPEQNQYAYILEGLNEEWVDVGNRRYAEYPNLAWGNYVFRLRGSNNDGVWNETGVCLAIEISPPFWATWWFVAGLGLFLAFSVVLGYRWRMHNIEQQSQRLAEQVFERTQEIERRRQMAAGLSEVIRLLNTNQPLEKSLDFIVRQAVSLTSASKAVIFERQGDRVSVRACYPEDDANSLDLNDPNSISARCLLESTFLNRLLIYSRVDPQTLKSDTRWELVHGDYRTVVCTPLLVDAQVYGGLSLYYGQDRIFSPDEINLANTLADQTALAIANDRLRTTAQDMAVTAERNRLARDLHDAVTQTLFSTSLIAEVLPRIWRKDPTEGERQLEELRQLTKGALGEMRTLLMELRPAAMDEADPAELFKHLIDAFTGRTGVPVHFETDRAGGCRLPLEVKNVYYRIAQEGLNNVVKHAEPSQVWFRFECQVDLVTLTISDDGQGFDQKDVPAGHLGLGIMSERAEAIGADLTLVSQPGEGTTLRLVWQFDQNTLK